MVSTDSVLIHDEYHLGLNALRAFAKQEKDNRPNTLASVFQIPKNGIFPRKVNSVAAAAYLM
jgi:hypothetical protein